METESRRCKILKIIFFILLLMLVFEVGIISDRKINNKKYLSLNDAKLTAKLIKTKYIFDTPYNEEELLNYSPKEQFKLIGDEFSQYLTEVEYEKRENSHNLKFVGLGFRSLQIDDGCFEILEALPNPPVKEAGLKSGDKTLKIDGNSIKNISILETINLIEEKKLKDIILTIQRNNKILCNENTASAGEMLIINLKEYNRCTTVGKKTFGKQVSQEIFQLNSKNKLVLSTGIPILPNEEIYNKIGIEPDFEISLDKNTKDKQMNKAVEILNK